MQPRALDEENFLPSRAGIYTQMPLLQVTKTEAKPLLVQASATGHQQNNKDGGDTELPTLVHVDSSK